MSLQIKPTPVRSYLIDLISGWMNAASEMFPGAPLDRITLRDHIRWFIEARLSTLFAVAFDHSADELEMAINGEIPPKHWNERQKAAVPDLAQRDAWCFSGGQCGWTGPYAECLPDHACPKCGKDHVSLH